MPLTKEKKKLNKLIQESDSDDSEHELAYYVNDRVKLMKEVLKTIKPKKIKAMAPSCLKHMEMEEINSMLLEELLGISNKRLKYIFSGQNLDEDSSSSTNEDEPIDIISLDDVSDDEFVINVDDDQNKNHPKLKKVKKEHKHPKVKREKCLARKLKKESEKNDKQSNSSEKTHDENLVSNKNLMSVLELLELQARARAIKSQLLLENAKTQENCSSSKQTLEEKIGSDDDVIIETVKAEEIIITSSESESETKNESDKVSHKTQIEVPENIVPEKTGESQDHLDMETSEAPVLEQRKVRILEDMLISLNNDDSCPVLVPENSDKNPNETKGESEKKIEKQVYNDEIIVINLSNDEIDELK